MFNELNTDDMTKHPVIINIYNFIRKTVYPSGEFIKEDYEAVIHQMGILKRYNLPCTYALKYDALMDIRFSELIRSNIEEYDEVGAWWEIDKQLAEKAGVKWKGETPIDDHVNIGYSLGYLPEERIKMVDVYMKDFKNVFGYYPKSIGAWVIDIITLNYAKEKYGIVAATICRDQIGTDGFTLWGGYFNQGYYPSKINEYMPAQNKRNQVDVPIFKLLGPDPIYSFEDGLRKGINGVYTLEPAGLTGKSREWIKWFFDRLINESVLGFSYAQVGQENTYLWENMCEGYELQIPYIAKLAKENKIRIETLEDTGRWFKSKYKVTPPTTFVASKDWNKEDLKTIWYNSRFYRISMLWDKNKLSIRDLHLFNENYKSRYYDCILNNNESIFDTLPILNAHYWSDKEKRASIDLVKVNYDGKYTMIEGKEPEFIQTSDSSYKIKWEIDTNNKINIICRENEILLEIDGDTLQSGKFALHINKLPVLKRINNKTLTCEHNNFIYSLELKEGEFMLQSDCSILIISNNNNKIVISLDQNIGMDKNDGFFTEYYINNKNSLDNYVPSYKKKNQKVIAKAKAFKPIIDPKIIIKRQHFDQTLIIKNPNDFGEIRYTLNGSIPNEKSNIYEEPIYVSENCIIKAIAYKDGFMPSEIAEGKLYTTLPIKAIKGITNPTDNKRYNTNGVYDLIDGKKGSIFYTDGCWLGYNEDVDVIVDIGQIKDIKKIEIGFLQNTRTWIYYPKYIQVEISKDGEKFESLSTINLEKQLYRREIGIENISINNNKPIRYIRIFAKNPEVCPKWSIMPGKGPTFMFVDQIIIN